MPYYITSYTYCINKYTNFAFIERNDIPKAYYSESPNGTIDIGGGATQWGTLLYYLNKIL